MPISSACLVFDGACPPHRFPKRPCRRGTSDSSISPQPAGKLTQGALSLLDGCSRAGEEGWEGRWQVKKSLFECVCVWTNTCTANSLLSLTSKTTPSAVLSYRVAISVPPPLRASDRGAGREVTGDFMVLGSWTKSTVKGQRGLISIQQTDL